MVVVTGDGAHIANKYKWIYDLYTYVKRRTIYVYLPLSHQGKCIVLIFLCRLPLCEIENVGTCGVFEGYMDTNSTKHARTTVSLHTQYKIENV